MTADATLEAMFDGSTWTDITSYVRNIPSVRRGRANDLSVVDPGVLTVELDNNDGRFTPENSQGAYYPNVKPTVAVRLTVTAGELSTSYRLFTGFAQRWEPQWTVGGRPIVILEAVDGFEKLSQRNIAYPHREVVRDSLPDAYWPGTGSGGVVKDIIGGRDIQEFSSSVEFTDSLVSGGPSGFAVSTDSTALFVQRFNPPASWWGASNDVTFSIVFRIDTLTGSEANQIFWHLSDNTSASAQGVFTDFAISSNKLQFRYYDGVSVSETLTSDTLTWSEGTTYQIGVHWDTSAKTATFYRNGAEVGSDTAATAMVAPANVYRLGEWLNGADGTEAYSYSEMMLWTSDKSALMPALAASVDGYASELPGARIGRLLDWAEWDASDRDIDTGSTPLAAIDSTATVLRACQDAAAADGGVFYISRTGDAVFQGRRGRWEDESGTEYSDTYSDTYGTVGGAVVAFDDDGTDTGYQTVGWRFDTTLLHNDIVIDSNTQGTSDGTADDSTSQTAYGTRTLTISTISNNTADNAERADWELSRRKDPHLRLEEVSFLVADAVQEDTAGPMELQDRVDVFRRPGAGQDDLTVEMRVASIDHLVADGGKTWRITVGLLEASTDQPGIYGVAVYGTDYYGY